MAGTDLARLQEDKEYLELKLKYVQSVSTIFRQKVAVLLRNVWGSPQRGETDDVIDDDGQVNALREMMAEMEANEHSPPRQSLVESDRSEYWRERFLRAMEETRPTNLQEAQTLCTLLQERNEMAENEAALRRGYGACQIELQKMKDNYIRVLNDRAMSADEAVVERFRHKESEILALTPSGTSIAMEQADALRVSLQKSESKLKVLRLRNAQLNTELEGVRSEFARLHETHRSQISELTSAMKEVRAKLSVRDAEARRAESSRIKAEQSVMLKESTISRLEARIYALEKEVDAVLKEGTGSLDTNEGAILRRQIDTFELKLRECEDAIAKRDGHIVELEATTDILRETIAAKQLQIDAKHRLAETLQKRLAAQGIDGSQRDAHQTMINTFEERMLAAVSEVTSRQNASDLAEKVAALQAQIRTLTSAQATLAATKAELSRTTQHLTAYKDELARCVKLGRVPALDSVENDIVKNDLRPVTEGGDGHRAGATGEVVLRTEGPWKEIRDINSGCTFFVTTDASVTPFKPSKVQAPSPPKPVSKPPTPRVELEVHPPAAAKEASPEPEGAGNAASVPESVSVRPTTPPQEASTSAAADEGSAREPGSPAASAPTDDAHESPKASPQPDLGSPELDEDLSPPPYSP